MEESKDDQKGILKSLQEFAKSYWEANETSKNLKMMRKGGK